LLELLQCIVPSPRLPTHSRGGEQEQASEASRELTSLLQVTGMHG